MNDFGHDFNGCQGSPQWAKSKHEKYPNKIISDWMNLGNRNIGLPEGENPQKKLFADQVRANHDQTFYQKYYHVQRFNATLRKNRPISLPFK